MQHPDIDSTLCAAESLLESLDDGYSPPAQPQPQQRGYSTNGQPADPALGPQSLF